MKYASALFPMQSAFSLSLWFIPQLQFEFLQNALMPGIVRAKVRPFQLALCLCTHILAIRMEARPPFCCMMRQHPSFHESCDHLYLYPARLSIVLHPSAASFCCFPF